VRGFLSDAGEDTLQIQVGHDRMRCPQECPYLLPTSHCGTVEPGVLDSNSRLGSKERQQVAVRHDKRPADPMRVEQHEHPYQSVPIEQGLSQNRCSAGAFLQGRVRK
jgi:hypothetical protein